MIYNTKHMKVSVSLLRVGIFIALSFSCVRNSSAESANQHFARGALAEQEGNYDEALRQFGAAVELDPFYCEGYLVLGVIYQRRGKDDLAIALLEKGIACLTGPTVHALFGLSEIQRQLDINFAAKRLEKLKTSMSQSLPK